MEAIRLIKGRNEPLGLTFLLFDVELGRYRSRSVSRGVTRL
jgi:hypothetical protein